MSKQPVRNVIKDTHSDKLTESYLTLLVDGTNLLKISMADDKVNSRGEHVGGIYQFLYQLRKLMVMREWDYVYVFFDDEDSGLLRYKLYTPYKANRDKHYGEYAKEFNKQIRQMQKYFYKNKTDEEIKKAEDFARERRTLLKYFEEMYVRWMMDPITEGDDLIAYYVLHKKEGEKIVIVSSDEDLTQLLSDDVYIYNPHLKENVTNKNFTKIYGYPYTNVLVKKIFCGDKSDNIGNIDGLSEDGLFKIIPEIKTRTITIEEVKDKVKILIDERKQNKKKPLKVYENILNGTTKRDYDGDFYEINEKLINLRNPLLTEDAQNELKSMMHTPQDPEGRSFDNLYRYIIEDDIIELKDTNKFASFFVPFKKIEEKEKKNYKIY